MRKLIAAIMTVFMLFVLCNTCVYAEQNSFQTGEWMLEYSLGGAVIAEQAVFLYDDNAFEIVDGDQSERGTWTFDGETLVLSASGVEMGLAWNSESNEMTGEYEGMKVRLYTSVEPENKDETAGTGMLAGWTVSEDPTITSEIEQLVWTALDKYQTGTITISYTPVAYLGSQLVAGTNHAVLCRASEINKGSSWVIIYIYEDLQGEASVLNIADFDFGGLCTYGAE